MASKKLFRNIRSRELEPVALAGLLERFKLVYTEGSFSMEVPNEALISIEPELLLAVNIGNYIPQTKKARIVIFNEQGWEAGILNIHQEDILKVENSNIYVYRIHTARSYLLPFYSRLPDNIAHLIKKKSGYRINDVVRLRKLFVYYLKAKPAFFVSVKRQSEFDIFPVDLVGNVANGYFSVAIKSSNKAIDIIKTELVLCLSALPFSQSDIVYKHSEQRKEGKMNVESLLFKISESKTLKIPVPDFAIQVNELHVERVFEKGMYTVFIAKSISMYTLSDALPLAHTPWYNRTKG